MHGTIATWSSSARRGAACRHGAAAHCLRRRRRTGRQSGHRRRYARDYSGPPPATADVQRSRSTSGTTSRRPTAAGTATTRLARRRSSCAQDDVNLAYDAANTVVNLTSPRDSRMVQKVGGGHNCWLASNAACADIMTTWIRSWAGSALAAVAAASSSRPPPIKDPGASKTFPDGSGALRDHRLSARSTQYCSRCHTSTAASAQSPFFASTTSTRRMPLRASRSISTIRRSRGSSCACANEFHNCWSDCDGERRRHAGGDPAFANRRARSQPSIRRWSSRRR